MSLDPERWEADGLLGGEGLSLAEARQTPAAGMENLLDGGRRAAGVVARLAMAKVFEKTLFVRMGVVFMRPMIKLGLGGKDAHLLTVVDHESGESRTTPVTIVENEEGRWLVAPYGPTRWVQSARAAGWVELRRGRRRERLRAVEVGPEEGAPVLREYVQRVAMVRPYFDVDSDAPVEAFVAEVPGHPVFHLAGPAA